ncbi:MAG: T9SS type A sorting domain-containing protein [Bacteroidales bacterium]
MAILIILNLPKGVVKIIDTLLVYSDEEITKFPFSQDFPVLTSFTAPEQGIYHLGMRILTPVKNAKARTRLSIDAFKVSNPTPYRIAINAAVYPQSSCDRGVEQVRLGFYNEGTERYADSMQIKLFYTLNGKDTVCLQKKTFLRLDAKMEISKSVFVNFDNIDMSAKGLYKFWATAQYKDDKGNIKNSSVFGSAVIGNTILNASPSSTPFAMSFEDQEYYQDWIGISAAAVGTWRRINTAGIRSAEQRDSTPMVMEAFAPSTGSTNAYLKSTCFQLSADSIYTLSSWIKWVGDTTVGPDGSTIRYSIAKTPTAVAFNKQNAVIYVNTQLHGLKEWTQFSKDFTVDSNQVYYIGFLFKAKTNTAAIHFDDVRLCARAKIAPIQNLKSSEITQNTAKISWDSISYPSTFYYKLSLNNVLVKDSLTTNTYNLTGLVANTQYTIQLEAWVAGQTNTSESSHTFTTLKSEIPIPANLAITQITAHTAIFSWDAVELDSAYSYTVYLDSTIVSQNSKATQYKFEKLKANTNYTASLALVVSHATENPLLQSRKFTTLKDTLAIEKGIENTFVKIYPNPSTNGLFTLQIQKAYQAYILDYQGRELLRISLNSGGHILDLSKYPKGIYFLYLQNKQENKVCKIINQ